MLIECLRHRPGGSVIDLDGALYHFRPDAQGRHVAEVEARAHISRLLAIPEGYRPADEPPASAAPPPAREEPQVQADAPDEAPTPAEKRPRGRPRKNEEA